MSTLWVSQLPSIYRIGKWISTYTRYTYNSVQSDFDLLIDHKYAKIIIIAAIDTDLLGPQYDKLLYNHQNAAQGAPLCGNFNFNHFFLLNYKGLACLINKFVQNN